MTHRDPPRVCPTVLVVDDEPRVCQLFEKILHEEGYHVLTAMSGEQALTLAAEARPGLPPPSTPEGVTISDLGTVGDDPRRAAPHRA